MNHQAIIEPADIIIVPKHTLSPIKHYAIYLGFDQDGNEWIAENDRYEGTTLISTEAFFEKNPEILEIQKFSGTDTEREEAIQRAIEGLGQRYQLLRFNCEHYANKAQSNRSHSSQANNAIKGAILGVGGVFLLRVFKKLRA